MKYCEQCRSTYPTDFSTCPKDQSALVATAELAPGMVLRGKYEILEKIGAGGMATVYRVLHRHLKEEVAIKVVSGRFGEDPSFLERFQTEAVVTRRLRHPNAVRLDDFDVTDDGRPFIVMELVRGQSLRALLQKSGWMQPPRAASIARQAALALGAAHELGIVHRDIKPENLVLVAQPDGSELVKVLDFGIARLTGNAAALAGTQTRTGIILGTPQYVSPEQAKGAKSAEIDGRSDLYSLGIVLYEMLTGMLPFRADTAFDLLLHHVQTPAKPPHEAAPQFNIPPALSELVMKCLAKDPAARFQSAAELAEALADPELTVQAEPNAQVFGTAALAAAAAAAQLEVEAAASAQTAIAQPTTQRITVASDPTLAMGSRTLTCQPTMPVDSMPIAAPTAAVTKTPFRWKKWHAAAAAGLVIAALSGGILAFQGEPAAAAGPPVQAASESPESTRGSSTPRVKKERRATARPSRPAPVVDNSAEAQQWVSTGYKRLERRDYPGAQAAFSRALELDPGNQSAQRGMQVAQGGQLAEGLVGIIKR